MNNPIVNVRVRLIIIKNDKILLHFTEDGHYYFYPGGHLEFGETIIEACVREIKEETTAQFTFQKILYIRDFIHLPENEHSLEFFILGDIDKYEELEGFVDPQSAQKGFKSWQNWIDLDKLPATNVKPKSLTPIILSDFKSNFSEGTKYLGQIA